MQVEQFTASLLLWLYVLFQSSIAWLGEVFSTAVLDRKDEYAESRNYFV